MDWKILPGRNYPLGATWTGTGVNFALHTENATRVELCLFNADGDAATEQRITLPGKTHYVFHGFIPDMRPGQLYGYRLYGPYKPHKGHRFNPSKLLLDPYAKAITGDVQWNDAMFSYTQNEKDDAEHMNQKDSAPFVPKSIVIDPRFDWEHDRRPKIPLHETVVYELHVKGFTWLQPKLEERLRGKYAGIANEATIEYLKSLGITTVELMPVHFYIPENYLIEKGLTNYWGYNTIGFFAPHEAYASGKGSDAVREFKGMVKALHRAGLEVILDVVFNHTAEGNHCGPTFSFRGIDNAVYYRLTKKNATYYMDYTGTGNTLNTEHPAVLQLVMDSLRYWITEMHVDGFRFDLAPALARYRHKVDPFSAFFMIICQDPVISQVKLIAEPWDVGEKGYHVGNFPPHWTEWNDRFRDGMRDYWRHGEMSMEEFMLRFSGSPDLYNNNDRLPTAGINFITAHDGFTLHDLVTYKNKDNSRNLSDTPDGAEENRSVNWGVEGESDDPAIRASRNLHKRNLLATLLLSQGVPMMYAGDEVGNSQAGNNNAYSQDNELSWIDWEHADKPQQCFVKRLLELRKNHPVFHLPCWPPEQDNANENAAVISWYLPSGKHVSPKKMRKKDAQPICVYLDGGQPVCVRDNGECVSDQSYFIVFNNSAHLLDCVIPESCGSCWEEIVDTAHEQQRPQCSHSVTGNQLQVSAFSITVLQKKQ